MNPYCEKHGCELKHNLFETWCDECEKEYAIYGILFLVVCLVLGGAALVNA